jgi:hypothetical protein
VRKETLLGARFLLVAAATTEAGVEFLGFDRVEKRYCLQGIAGGERSLFFFHPAGVDRGLNGANDQTRAEFFGKRIAICDGLREVVAGVHMKQRKRNFRGPEGFRRQVGHHDRILAAREE